jgi:hypothetical protein
VFDTKREKREIVWMWYVGIRLNMGLDVCLRRASVLETGVFGAINRNRENKRCGGWCNRRWQFCPGAFWSSGLSRALLVAKRT